MNKKYTKSPGKYIPYTRFIIAWFIFAYILKRLPFPLPLYPKIYLATSVPYLIVTSSFYGRRTTPYVYYNYREACDRAMGKLFQIPPWHDNETDMKRYFSLTSFDKAVRAKYFQPMDITLQLIYRNSIYQFIFISLLSIKISFIYFMLAFMR